jgi:hypothetical protein
MYVCLIGINLLHACRKTLLTVKRNGGAVVKVCPGVVHEIKVRSLPRVGLMVAGLPGVQQDSLTGELLAAAAQQQGTSRLYAPPADSRRVWLAAPRSPDTHRPCSPSSVSTS